MDLNGRNIAVLGAGIGGLAAAQTLARRGARVRVFEQAPELTEVGAGIQISQNGLTVLRAMGLSSVGGVKSQGVTLCDYRQGRVVLKIPPPAAGATRYFHRADLIALLAQAARDAGAEIITGHRAVSVTVLPEQATVRFADGSLCDAALVIGADGMRGVTRALVAPDTTARFSGQVAWRAVVPWQGGVPRAMVSMGPGQHVVTYPLRDGQWMNLVAIEERSDWLTENWHQQGDPNELRRRFAGFGGQAGAVLERVSTAHLWALHLHPVAARWHQGALALLGDAAHPTLPFMAQGGCLALEDAWVLADSLARAPSLAQALEMYQSKRLTRARRVVKVAEANARRFHARSPMREVAQIALMLAGRWIAPKYAWIYGHDVTG